MNDFDIRKVLIRKKPIWDMSIREIMNPHPKTILDTDMAITAAHIMEKRAKPFTVLPVIDKRKRSVGMIHLHDLVTQGLVQDPAKA